MSDRRAQERTRVLPSTLHVPEECRAVSEVLDRVGDKWTVLVIVTLGGGPKRFNELRRAIASVSQRMLTLTLRCLERDGLVRRTLHPTVPPRVEYALTELGRSLLVPVEGLGSWARQNRHKIAQARQRFDAKSSKPNSASSRCAQTKRIGAKPFAAKSGRDS